MTGYVIGKMSKMNKKKTKTKKKIKLLHYEYPSKDVRATKEKMEPSGAMNKERPLAKHKKGKRQANPVTMCEREGIHPIWVKQASHVELMTSWITMLHV